MDGICAPHMDGIYAEAVSCRDGGNITGWIANLTWAADLGHSVAQEELIADYMKGGIHRTQNYDQSIQFYLDHQSDSQNGYIDNYLGFMYRNGLGVTKNSDQARQYWRQAAHKNNPIANYNLAYDSVIGINCEKDLRLALTFYIRAQTMLPQVVVSQVPHLHLDRVIRELLEDSNNFDWIMTAALPLLNERTNSEIIQLCAHNNKFIQYLWQGMATLQTKNDRLLQHIEASPDGALYLEAQKHWNESTHSNAFE